MDLIVRKMVKSDELPIVEILNQAIRAGKHLAITEQTDVEQMRPWFDAHLSPRHPLWVAELNGQVVGWISLSAYRPGRKALERTVEVSYGVEESMRQRGVGTAMLAVVLGEARRLEHRVIFAIIFDNNVATRRLLDKFDFALWGHLPEVAELHGVRIGHDYLGKILTEVGEA